MSKRTPKIRTRYQHFIAAAGCLGIVGLSTSQAIAQTASCSTPTDNYTCYDPIQGAQTDGLSTIYAINDYGGATVWGQNYVYNSHGVGVYGEAVSGGIAIPGVIAGVYGITDQNSGYGVYGQSAEDASGYAAGYFKATNTGTYANGVAGVVAGVGTGGYFRTYGGNGVYAIDQGTSAGYGVYATSNNGTGVYGTGLSYGVYAVSTGTSSSGLYATCSGSNCAAIYSQGAVTINGGNVDVALGYSYLYNNSTCVGGHCASDERLKKDIAPLSGAMDKLLQLKGVTFAWKDPQAPGHSAGSQIGFVAQDVEKVFPAWVDEDKSGMKGISLPPLQLAALEVESLRTLKAENDLLKERVAALENGRKLTAGISLDGVGFAVGGLALAGAVIFTRRRRTRDQTTL